MRCEAGHGQARQGRQGRARRGEARPGWAWRGLAGQAWQTFFPVLERAMRLRALASMRRLAGNWFCYEKSSLGLPGPGSNYG